jgi:hypothetical protein
MAQTIEVGTLFLKKGTLLPDTLLIESDPYMKGWSLVKNLSSPGLDKKLCELGWTFFYMAGEVNALAFGWYTEKTIHRAIRTVIANMKSDMLNCLELSHVAAKSFLGVPYVMVSGHARHIQESIYLFRPNSISAADQVNLAAMRPAA